MADVRTNRSIWEETWDWSSAGEEWSAWWGGTPALWYGALLPRIHSFIPTGTILEIAPGFGRWTQYLKDVCDRLVIVDLAERCIDACRARFEDATNIEYHVNDGRSLEMVADGTIDFAFSFDSLVHVEMDVLDAYLRHLATKLKPDGVGFVHHSNLGEYRTLAKLTRRVPDPPLGKLIRRGALPDLAAWRAESVTAASTAESCEDAGLACIAQEKINWEHGRYLTDALTLFTPRGSRWERPLRVERNPQFRRDARRTSSLYADAGFPDART